MIYYGRVFKIEYLSETDTGGRQLKITDMKEKKSVTLSRDYSLDPIPQVLQYLNSIDIHVEGMIEYNEEIDLLFTTDFKNPFH